MNWNLRDNSNHTVLLNKWMYVPSFSFIYLRSLPNKLMSNLLHVRGANWFKYSVKLVNSVRNFFRFLKSVSFCETNIQDFTPTIFLLKAKKPGILISTTTRFCEIISDTSFYIDRLRNRVYQKFLLDTQNYLWKKYHPIFCRKILEFLMARSSNEFLDPSRWRRLGLFLLFFIVSP